MYVKRIMDGLTKFLVQRYPSWQISQREMMAKQTSCLCNFFPMQSDLPLKCDLIFTMLLMSLTSLKKNFMI